MEEENVLENKEKLEEVHEHAGHPHAETWVRYLSITTACIAVLAALASMKSGNLANSALLAKNDAILAQAQASDQWNYYQAKGIKKNIAEAMATQPGNEKLKSEADRYGKDQTDIQKQAQDLDAQVKADNELSEQMLLRHEKAATSVTFFQIAIAMSAMAALLKQKWFWFMSIGVSVAGLAFLFLSLSG